MSASIICIQMQAIYFLPTTHLLTFLCIISLAKSLWKWRDLRLIYRGILISQYKNLNIYKFHTQTFLTIELIDIKREYKKLIYHIIHFRIKYLVVPFFFCQFVFFLSFFYSFSLCFSLNFVFFYL